MPELFCAKAGLILVDLLQDEDMDIRHVATRFVHEKFTPNENSQSSKAIEAVWNRIAEVSKASDSEFVFLRIFNEMSTSVPT